MINIINVRNKCKVTKNLNIKEMGLIYYFINIEEEPLNIALENINITLEEFKSILENLQEKQILVLDIEVEKNKYVKWYISFLEEQESDIESEFIVEQVFILNKRQKEELNIIKDQNEIFIRAFKIYELNKAIYEDKQAYELNNIEEYKDYIKKINPIVLLNTLDVSISVKEVHAIYDAICIKKVSKEVVNLLIDYVVSTSIYKNFSLSYFNKILQNWQKNNISNLDMGIKYIQESKNKIQQNNTKYIEPETKIEEKYEKVDLEELEKLLKENKK